MSKRYLITGGAGFIGSNYAARLIQRGEDVTLFDNLSRAGATLNLKWLREHYGDRSFKLVVGDVRQFEEIRSVVEDADAIIHLAAQVAVTTSVQKPREDFEINALGTFNVLEAARATRRNPVVVYASTNKVYGEMEGQPVLEEKNQYRYAKLPYGISESQNQDFHSPYGCSKGAGDQYTRDYARIYGLPTVVLRQSCIYGTRQFGIEDQGWVAWFIIAAITGRKISIYGDGKQVRDILFVDDLLNAYDAAIANIEKVKGQIINIGGGPDNTISIWTEFGPMLEKLLGKKLEVTREDWRPGDQKIYISDIRKAQRELSWTPAIRVNVGVARLFEWVRNNQQLF